MTNGNTVTRERIAAMEPRIRPYIRHTPVLRVDMADFDRPPLAVDLKLECLQHSGSFKARGAFTNLLERPVPAAGVVAASGGNHGAAVAYAAMRLGHKATIFVPEVSPPAKLERIRGYGAELVVGGARYAEALAASEAFAEKTGACRSTPSTRRKRWSARARSGSKSRTTCLRSTRCWSPSAVAA